MSEFLNDFLTEEARGGPRAYLAAFGKHPGWNDHIDDLGIETESLVLAKRLVYLEGLSSQIDSGAWEKLAAEDRLEGFDHLMLWRRGTGTMLGTMISSRDGKGRTRYPMILCAQFIGVPVSRVLCEGRPVIESAMDACRATTSADEVRTIVTDARQKLRSLFGENAATGGTGASGRPLPGELELGPDDEGLRRILYHIRNHLAPWAPGQVTAHVEGNVRGAHLRMAQVFVDVDTAIHSWMEFFDTQIDARIPRLMLWPRMDLWIDVIVGEPIGLDFFGLRANRRALPCVDDVPYEMDTEFRANADEVIAQLAAPERKSARSILVRGTAAAAARARPEEDVSARPAGHGRKVLVFSLLGISALAGLIAVIVFLLRQPPPPMQTGSGPPAATTPAPVATQPSQGSAPLAPTKSAPQGDAIAGAPDKPVAVGDAWTVLCRDYYEWFGALQAALKDRATHARWAADAHLKAGVLDPMENARRTLGDLDPRVLAGVQGELQQLGGTPPASLQDPAVAEGIIAAHRVVKAIAGALDSWPRIAGAIEAAGRLEALGWSGSFDGRPVPQPLPWTDGLVAMVEVALKSPDALTGLAREAEAVMGSLQKLETSADPAVTDAVGAVRSSLVALHQSAVLHRELLRVSETLAPVLEFAGGEWTSGAIARDRFIAERGEGWATGSTGLALLGRWPDAARQFTVVPETELPLPVATWRPRVAAVQTLIEQLGQLAPGPEVEAFERRLEGVIKEWTALRGMPTVRGEMPARSQSAEAISAALEELSRQLSVEVGRRLDPVGWLQQVREIRFSDSAAVEADWVRRREALLRDWDPVAAKDDLQGFVAFRMKVEQAEHFLRDMVAHPGLAASAPSAGSLHADLAEELATLARRSREAAFEKLTRLAEAGNGDVPAFADFADQPQARAILDEHAATVKELDAVAADLAAVQHHLAGGAPWQEVPHERIAHARFGDSPKLQAQLARFSALEALSSSVDRAQLIAASGATEWTTAVTAWTQLRAQPGWPGNLAELQTLIETIHALAARSDAEIGDPAARARFHEQLAAARSHGWNTACAHAPDDDMAGVLALAETCGVRETDLSPRQRLNALVLRLRSLAWLSFDDKRGREERDRAVRELSAAAGADAAWVKALTDQIQQVSFDRPAVDYRHQGPGKVEGWKIDSAVDPERLAFLWDDFRVEFLLVEGLPTSVYLATTEVTARLFIEWISKRGEWAATIDAHKLLLEDFGSGDPRRGPRSYTVTNGSAASRKFARTDLHWLDQRIARNPEQPPPPSDRTPLNYVSLDAARLFSASLNCRLPTADEWKAAQGMRERAGKTSASANLRDARWGRQFDFQKRQRDPCWPDSDIFVPSGATESVPLGAAAQVGETGDDGVLWFAEVDSEFGLTFGHLIGNVAEYVLGEGGAGGVIGGSALSPPELSPTDFLPVDPRDATRGFSDVGLRLAFSIEQPSATAEVQRILLAAGFCR